MQIITGIIILFAAFSHTFGVILKNTVDYDYYANVHQLLKNNQSDKAFDLLDVSKSIDPEDTKWWKNIPNIVLKAYKNDYQKLYTFAVNLDRCHRPGSKNHTIYCCAKAIDIYQRIIQLNPNDSGLLADVHFHYASALIALDNWKEAKAMISVAIKYDKCNPEYWKILTSIMYHMYSMNPDVLRSYADGLYLNAPKFRFLIEPLERLFQYILMLEPGDTAVRWHYAKLLVLKKDSRAYVMYKSIIDNCQPPNETEFHWKACIEYATLLRVKKTAKEQYEPIYEMAIRIINNLQPKTDVGKYWDNVAEWITFTLQCIEGYNYNINETLSMFHYNL